MEVPAAWTNSTSIIVMFASPLSTNCTFAEAGFSLWPRIWSGLKIIIAHEVARGGRVGILAVRPRRDRVHPGIILIQHRQQIHQVLILGKLTSGYVFNLSSILKIRPSGLDGLEEADLI